MRNGRIGQMVNFLASNDIISEEDKEFYQFAFKQGFRMILNVITTFLIGSVLGMSWQSLLFLFAFIPIRSYAGGFHAATPLRCYLYSMCIITAVLKGISVLEGHTLIQAVLTLVSAIIIYYMAPIESHNKPLTKPERMEYRKKTIRWLVLLMAGVIVTSGIKQEISLCLSAAIAVSAVLLLLEINSFDKSRG